MNSMIHPFAPSFCFKTTPLITKRTQANVRTYVYASKSDWQ